MDTHIISELLQRFYIRQKEKKWLWFLFLCLSYFSRIKSQNLNDAFPLSDDLSGSGFDSGSGLGSGSGSSLPSEMEREYQPLLEDDVFYYDIKALKQNLPSEDQEMGHAGPEDEFIIWKTGFSTLTPGNAVHTFCVLWLKITSTSCIEILRHLQKKLQLYHLCP